MFNKKKKEFASMRNRLHEAVDKQDEMRVDLELADERERSLEGKMRGAAQARCRFIGPTRGELKKIAEQKERIEDAAETIEQLQSQRDSATEKDAEWQKQLDELQLKIDEAKRASECPSDCKNRKNANACRTCTRYPHAKDKYEVAR